MIASENLRAQEEKRCGRCEQVLAVTEFYADRTFRDGAGQLVRQPCEVCGERAHAHHADYAKPLEVQWLCPLHHMRQHGAEGRLRAAMAPTSHDLGASRVLVAPRDLMALLGDVTP